MYECMFHTILFNLKVFARNLLRGRCRRNIFWYCCFDIWPGVRSYVQKVNTLPTGLQEYINKFILKKFKITFIFWSHLVFELNTEFCSNQLFCSRFQYTFLNLKIDAWLVYALKLLMFVEPATITAIVGCKLIALKPCHPLRFKWNWEEQKLFSYF